MELSGFLPGRMLPVAVVVLSAAGLSGCFDLEQKVDLHSNGSGTYTVAVSADGLVGRGLAEKHDDIDLGDDDDNAVKRVARHGDRTVETSEIAFRNLSDLHLSDETLSLHVKGQKLLGLGGTEVNFHRTFHVDRARRHHDEDDDHIGRDVLNSMFGDHTYKFTVWLPGSIEHIAPLRVGDHVVHPTVWADRYGHTIVWTMRLTDMFLADRLEFDVDFAAHGDFHNAQSQPGRHRHHRRHNDDDDDDSD
jgi:hypothetical protein